MKAAATGVLQNYYEILDIFTSLEYANVMLNLGITSGFQACCVTPPIYK